MRIGISYYKLLDLVVCYDKLHTMACILQHSGEALVSKL